MKRLYAALGCAAAILLALCVHFRRAPAEAAVTPTGRGGGALRQPGQGAAGRPAGGATATGARGAHGHLVLRGAWGGGPGEFGRRRDAEANPEAPMAVVAGRAGDLAIVDQVNRRVQRFHDGKLAATIPLGGDTVQDLALGPEGRTVLLDRLADGNVQVYDAGGRLLSEAPLVGPGIAEGGDVTGVFADENGVWAERQHGSVVRVADPNGNADAERPELLGRPSRDGHTLLQAEIANRGSGEVLVRATDRASGELAWVVRLAVGVPILHIVMLDSDVHGNSYLAVDGGHEAPAPDFGIADERIVAVRLGPGGVARGTLELPPVPGADETFRPLSVDDDGVLYVMVAGETGLQVTRYTFP